MADALWWRIRETQRLPPCPLPPSRQIHLNACGSRTLPVVFPSSAGVCIRRRGRSCAPASASFGGDRLLPVNDDGTSLSQAAFALCLSENEMTPRGVYGQTSTNRRSAHYRSRPCRQRVRADCDSPCGGRVDHPYKG